MFPFPNFPDYNISNPELTKNRQLGHFAVQMNSLGERAP